MNPLEIKTLEGKLKFPDHELTKEFGAIDYDHIEKKALSFNIVGGEKAVLFEGKVLNNHSYRAMVLADIKIEAIDLTGDLEDAINYKASRLNSKEYTQIQKIVIIMKLEPEYAKAVNGRKSQKISLKRQGKEYPDELNDSRTTLEILCDLIGSNVEYVRRTKKIQEENPYLYSQLVKEKISLSEAFNLFNDSKEQKDLNEVVEKYPEIYKSITSEDINTITEFAKDTDRMRLNVVMDKYLFHLDFHRNNTQRERENIRAHSTNRDVKKLSWEASEELPLDVFLDLLILERILSIKDPEGDCGGITKTNPKYHIGPHGWIVYEKMPDIEVEDDSEDMVEVTQQIVEPQEEEANEDDANTPKGCFKPSLPAIQKFKKDNRIGKGKYVRKSFAGIEIELNEDSSSVVNIQGMQDDFEELLSRSRVTAEKLTKFLQSSDIEPEIFNELNDFIAHIDYVSKDLKNKLFYYYK